jgi:tetratricopeptide (TPR) repeat protein
MMRSAILILSLVLARSAAAQHAAEAEALFRKGRALMADTRYEEACAAFESSQKLDPAVTTQLNLADCREKNGQLATAWGLFVEVGRHLRGKTDAASQQLAGTAATRAAKLEPRLSRLRIAVKDHDLAGLVVVRGGETLDAAMLGQAMPIDGGKYKIVARAPGREEWSKTIKINREGDDRTVTIPELPQSGDTASPPREEPTEPEPVRPAGRSRTLPIALTAAAVALGGAAIGFELWGESIYDDANHAVDPQATALWRSANDKRYIAEGVGVAAVGCAGAALYLWLRHTPASNDTALISPLAGPSVAGVQVSGRW